MLYNSILDYKKTRIAALVDPDKFSKEDLPIVAQTVEKFGLCFIMVGGSFVSSSVDETVAILKQSCNLPIVLFPGSLLQVTNKADALFMLSLISGRNAEYLIGNHVVAAPFLRSSNLEIIPTGYMLIENGKTTSVEYMSNTMPIPEDKIDIAVATAMAGEMLGHKMIYLEAGSGALKHVPTQMIAEIKKKINIPLIVGGGIRSRQQIEEVSKAGADIIVIGSILEKSLDYLQSLII